METSVYPGRADLRTVSVVAPLALLVARLSACAGQPHIPSNYPRVRIVVVRAAVRAYDVTPDRQLCPNEAGQFFKTTGDLYVPVGRTRRFRMVTASGLSSTCQRPRHRRGPAPSPTPSQPPQP